MPDSNSYDVIIVGGSYAGMSAAMCLGRTRHRTLVLDGGLPRNRFTPHAHNLLLHDGDAPATLAAQARQQVARYPSITQFAATATAAEKLPDGTFQVSTDQGIFQATLMLLATGLRDIFPDLPGFVVCWGKSVIHCPYCHGYEVADQPTGLLLNGDMVGHMVPMLRNWTADLTLFTNGPATFGPEMRQQLQAANVRLEETPVTALLHEDGQLTALALADGRTWPLPVLYAGLPNEQASALPAQLGCTFDERGLIVVDETRQTTVPGLYAAGDNSTMPQLVQALAAGNMAGAMMSRSLIFNAVH